MAEKTEKKPDDKAAAAAAPAPAEKKHAPAAGGMLKSTPMMLGAVMILEAVVLFGGFKFLGGGAKTAHADTSAEEPGEGGEAKAGAKGDKKKFAEVKVVEMRAPNRRDGRTFQYDVSIYARTKGESKEKLEGAITDNAATIQDRIRTIIGQCDPEKLGGGSEPGLETLRRQVKFQLDEILGEGLIEEVLIPRCMPYRTEF
jgi:flagellar basal body-associated protein FliL